jgi:hypothetical protein
MSASSRFDPDVFMASRGATDTSSRAHTRPRYIRGWAAIVPEMRGALTPLARCNSAKARRTTRTCWDSAAQQALGFPLVLSGDLDAQGRTSRTLSMRLPYPTPAAIARSPPVRK